MEGDIKDDILLGDDILRRDHVEPINILKSENIIRSMGTAISPLHNWWSKGKNNAIGSEYICHSRNDLRELWIDTSARGR